jgi:hypothetical protein
MSDGRTCAVCGTTGMVHVEGEPTAGPTHDPVIECATCGRTWVSKGTQYYLQVTDDTTDQELEAFVEQVLADEVPTDP